MSSRVGIIHDPAEAEAARQGAAFAFLDLLEHNDARHLVTDAALARWYGWDCVPDEPEPDPDRRDLWERRVP